MSWHMEFIAENKKAARDHLATQYCPDAVKEFLTLAIDGIKDDGLLSVKSYGHLAGADSYQVSTDSTEVKRLHITASLKIEAP